MILQVDWPAPANVKAITTTRWGGVSRPPYDSFNLATHVGDETEHVAQNRQLLSQQPGLVSGIQWLEQVHGTGLVKASSEYAEFEADASWTDQAGLACAVMTADCLPVLLCSGSGSWVAAIHAGWRGLAAGILSSTIRELRQSDEPVLAWLGPAIGPDCFEVGPEVRQVFVDQDEGAGLCFVPSQRPDHYKADIYALARLQLQNLGVGQVYGGQHCTYSESSRFYSYRRDGVTGRMASLIWIDG